MGRAMLSNSLIWFAADELDSVPSLSFGLRPNSGRSNNSNGSRSPPSIGLMPVLLCSVPLTPEHATLYPCFSRRLLDTRRQAWLSLLWGHFFSPGSWCTQGFVCALQESVSPVLGKFCNQSPLASKVQFQRVLSPFARFPGWEICPGSQNFLNSARISSVQLFCSLWVFCSAALWWGWDLLQEGSCHTLRVSGLLLPEPLSLRKATAEPCLCRRHSDTSKAGLAQYLWVSGSWCAQRFVWALWVSLVGIGFDCKHDFSPLTILLGLLLCPLTWGIFFWWDPTFSCWWLRLQPSGASCNFGVLTGDEHTSFYSAILCSWNLG